MDTQTKTSTRRTTSDQLRDIQDLLAKTADRFHERADSLIEASKETKSPEEIAWLYGAANGWNEAAKMLDACVILIIMERSMGGDERE